MKELDAIVTLLLSSLQEKQFEFQGCNTLAWLDTQTQVVAETLDGLSYVGISDAKARGCYIRRNEAQVRFTQATLGACATARQAALQCRLVLWDSEAKTSPTTLSQLALKAVSGNVFLPTHFTVSFIKCIPNALILDKEQIVEEEMGDAPSFNPIANLAALDFELTFIYNPCNIQNNLCS